jgi:hypothetical protein
MQTDEPDAAVTSVAVFRGAERGGDPSVDAQLVGNGDLQLLAIRRAGVWVYSEIDTIGWWTWHTVRQTDLPRLVGAGGDVLAAVRAAVAPGDEPDEADDEHRVAAIFRRFEAWLAAHGVPFTRHSYDEHEP